MMTNRMRLAHHHLSSVPEETLEDGCSRIALDVVGRGYGRGDGAGPYEVSGCDWCYCDSHGDGHTEPYDDISGWGYGSGSGSGYVEIPGGNANGCGSGNGSGGS